VGTAPEPEKPHSTASEDISKEVSLEEKFPTKPVENKSGVFVEYDPASAVAKLSNISALEPAERFEAFLTQAHLRQAPDHDP